MLLLLLLELLHVVLGFLGDGVAQHHGVVRGLVGNGLEHVQLHAQQQTNGEAAAPGDS